MKTSLTIIATLCAALSGCGGGDDSSTDTPQTVYKTLGSKQCSGGGVSLAELEQQLGDAGAGVTASSCGADGRLHPAVCDAADGRIGIFTVSRPDRVPEGFAPLSDLPDAKQADCAS